MQTIKAQIKFKKNRCLFTIFGKTFELDERKTDELFKSFTELHNEFSKLDYKCFVQIESQNGTSQTSIVNNESVNLMLANLINVRRINKTNGYNKVVLLANNTKTPSTRAR